MVSAFQLFDPTRKAALVEKAQLFLISAIMFFIPISPAAPNILGVLLIIVWIWQAQYKASWLKIKDQPIFWAFLVYLLLYPVSLLWSDNQAFGQHMVERHMLYLLFPFVLMAAKKEYLRYYVSAFVLGVTFTEITSYLVWFEIIHIEGVSAHDPTPFYFHVEYNPLLAWAIYLLMYGLFFEKHPLWLKLIFGFFITTMTVNMFITGGRGGQATYFVIVGLLFLQYFAMKKQLVKGAVLGVVFVASVFMLAYQSSHLFQSRIDMAVHEVENYTPQSEGSVAYRLHMYINTIELSFDRSIGEVLFGSGVGDFPEDYNRFVGPDAPFHMNAVHVHPHNQFLYQLGALGLVGLFSLLAIFWYAFKVAKQSDDEFNNYRLAFIVFLFVVNLSDSLLLAHPTSLLFIVFSAVLFASYTERNKGLE